MGVLNMNMATPGASVGGGLTRVRFNSHDYRKYVKVNPITLLPEDVFPPTASGMSFPAYWDANLRSCEYLNEFLTANPTWRTQLTTGPFALTTAQLRPPHIPPSDTKTEILAMLDAAPDREDRFLEIIDQNEADGAIGYFLGMLMIDPSRMPATYLLIRVAQRIGEHVAMCLKGELRCPRPSQLCTAIMPMIDPPATPSFPSGHSIQSRLFALCLEGAMPVALPNHLLDDLAERIGENRVIAGLHYPRDHSVGVLVANKCYQLLTGLQGLTPPRLLFKKLVDAAKIELTHTQGPAPA